jgi:uncharacterized membrane protein
VGFFDRGEAHTRSFLKAVSWRFTGSVDTFVISFIVTGKISLAGTIASVEVVTKIALYYLHERAWGPFDGDSGFEARDGARFGPIIRGQGGSYYRLGKEHYIRG